METATLKAQTPREYLSWSQLNLWETDREKYIDVYFRGHSFTSKRMELGKRIAQGLEDDVESQDDNINFVREFLPKFKHREYKIEDVSVGGVPILCKLDGFDDKPLGIDEVKTGVKWTQAMVNQSGQLTFYSLGAWLKFGEIPYRIDLHWAETCWDDEADDYVLTGKLKTFHTSRKQADLIRMTARIIRAWKEIKIAYKEFQKNENL